MNNDDFTFSLKAKLEKLFSEYQGKLQSDAQEEIIQNGFVFSEVDPTASVLVMGINPSLRTDFLNEDLQSYDYKQTTTDRYFKKLHNLLVEFEPFGITYCDLFYQRHSEQKKIDHFLSDAISQAFLKDQLQLTREVISYISPKLILLFNRKGAQFFSPEWMGLTLHQYSGNLDINTRVNQLFSLDDSDTLVYLSAFLGYRTPKVTYAILSKDLPKILAILKDSIE